MREKTKKITVFEHQKLRLGVGKGHLSQVQLNALQKFYGVKGVPYYSLIHRGVKFGEYVGVIQVGDTTIEVLPKADKSENSAESWREVLIGMLHSVGVFDIHAPSSSTLHLKSNSILDLYFELFIRETEYLLHRGLVKKYRKTEGNNTSLKGSIQFAKHIQKNLVHQERFYVRHTTYDKEHTIHRIMYKALMLLFQINSNPVLSSRLGALLLNFPEMSGIKITDALFEKLQFDRKTESYRNAIEIARLILLNYHPDVSRGQNDVLALMFDMNMLWEQFVYVSLRKYKATDMSISAQNPKYFWKADHGSRSKMIPDIVLNKGMPDCVVLDTKWKNLSGYNPSPQDLRQMYVYMKYYKAVKVALVYPGDHKAKISIKGGKYFDESGVIGEEECSVISLSVNKDIKAWQKEINDNIMKWCSYPALTEFK